MAFPLTDPLLAHHAGEITRELSTGGHVDGVTCVAFSHDGLRLATGSHDSLVLVWDCLTGTRLFKGQDHSGSITAAIYLDADTAAGGEPNCCASPATPAQ